MGVTGACAEIFTITVPEQLDADYDQPVTHAALAAVIDEETIPVEANAYVDADLHGDDVLGF